MNRLAGYFVPLIVLCFVTARVFSACTSTHSKQFTPSNDGKILSNPERGFYRVQEIHTSQSGYDTIELDDLLSYRKQSVWLVFIEYYLTPFISSDISDPVLKNMERDLETVRRAGLKAIIRFAYSESSSQDAKLSQIQRHIDQVKGILKKNLDIVTAVQAGFVGQWGEWYYSDNFVTAKDGNHHPAGKEDPKKVIDKLVHSIPNRIIQVRTPSIKQKYCGTANIAENNAFNLDISCSRIGFHNDCFLAPNQDLGTFTDNSQRDWLQIEGQYVMVGGETCSTEGTIDCSSSLNQILKQRFTYLNLDYHGDVIKHWKDGNCFNKIANTFGYRFELINGQLPSQVKPGNTYCGTVTLKNTGVTSVYYSRPVQVILRNKSTTYTATVDTDIRKWFPGKTINLNLNVAVPSNAPVGTYDVILNLPDPSSGLQNRPEYRIIFSNDNIVESATRYNILNQVEIK